MSGLVGVVDEHMGKEALESLLRSMNQSITHEDWYQTFLYATASVGLGRASLGIINPAPQPIFDRHKSSCIVMEGEIHNAEDLRQRFASPSQPFPIGNDPELLLHLYKVQGLDFVKEINGSFTLAIWDNARRKLIIANDRYGLRPLYYTQVGARLLFASEVKAILQDPKVERTVDDEAVADFLTFQTIMGNKTLLANVKVLPPASILVYQDGQLSLQQYWDFDFREDDRLSEDAYIENLRFLVRQAVERRMRGSQSKGVFLSGGLDSRLLLGAIDQKHFPVHSFTQGLPGCNDVKFAKEVAECVGSVHHYTPFGPEFLPSFSERGVWLTDGMMSCEDMSRLNILASAREHSEIALDGLGGAIIGGHYVTKGCFDETLNDEKFVDLIYGGVVRAFSDRSKQRLCTDRYLPRVKGSAYESVKKAVSLAPPVSYANRSEYIYLKNRQRRGMFFGPIMTRSQLECRTPLYDNDIVEFSYTIPPEFKLGKRLYFKFLSKSFPDLARIPYAFYGIPVMPNIPLRFFIRRGFYRVKRELRDRVYRLTSGRVILPYYREYKDTSYWLRAHLRDWVEDILMSQRTADRGYFNISYIRQLIDEHMSGEHNHRSRICTLLTFELWHRSFID
jgi:asparagine synthase (glutamine-hydrolysing)